MKTPCLLVFLALASALQAGPAAPLSPPPLPPAAPSESLWNFRVAPYAWVTAIDGDVRIGSLSAPVDISMSDTLDTLDMTYMGQAALSYGRWTFAVDAIYAKTSQDIDAGDRLFKSFRYEQKQWLTTPTLSYRVIDTPGYHMDLVAGARITSLEAELTGRLSRGGQIAGEKDNTWVDPLVGIRGQADLSDQWFFRYSADIGGFGASSELIWQAFGGIGYNFTENVSVAVGYRGLGMDYDKENFALDTVSHGPVIGLEVRF